MKRYLSLFSPLAAQHAAFYSEVLLVLFAETQHHQEPLSRELSITLVTDVLEALGEMGAPVDLHEDQSSLNIEDQSDMRSKAGIALRYLVRSQWLHEEIQSDFSVAYTLPDYAFRILSVFDDLATGANAPLQGLIYTIHDLLQAAVRDGDEPLRISQAHRETMRLLNALKELQHNISVHIEAVLQQTNPRDVLEQAFGTYLHEITRRAYHELRTTDHVSRFRRSIHAALTELSRRDYASRAESVARHNGSRHQGQSARSILEQLQDMSDQFDTLDGLLQAIDSRHSQFFESAIRSVEHTLLASSTTSGHLRTILTSLLDPQRNMRESDDTTDRLLDGELDQLTSFYELSLLDEKSLAPARRTREAFAADLQDTTLSTDEEILAAQEETLAQMFRAVSRARIRKFAYDLLKRFTDLVKGYLDIAGWELLYHEQCVTFQVIHRDGSHRKRLSLDTTIWLLLLRMLYAEQEESTTPRLTRYPSITIDTLIRRYTELPHARKYKRTSLEDALRQLQQSPFIRAANGGSLKVRNGEQVIELLPPLEAVITASNAAALATKLAEYGGPSEEERGEDE